MNRFFKVVSGILSCILLFLATLASVLSWPWSPYSEYSWMGHDGADRLVSNDALWALQNLSIYVLLALALASVIRFSIKENRRGRFAAVFLGIVFLVAASSITRLVVLSFVPEHLS